MAYTTLAELKRYLGIPSTETQDDDILPGFITAAEAAIDAECGRWFEARAETRTYGREVVDGPMLYLDADLLSLTSVTNGDGAALALADVLLWPRNTAPAWALRLKSTQHWALGDPDAAIIVVGQWGYTITAPAAVASATRRLAGFLYRQKDAPLGVAQLGVAANNSFGSIAVSPELLADLQSLLRGLRRRTT